MLYTLPLIAQAVLASTAAQGLLRQHDDSDPTSLPGGSPLTFCNDSRATDLFSVHQIELYPNPLHMYIPHSLPITSLTTIPLQ